MKGGLVKEELGLENLETIASVLQHALDSEKGVIGFGKHLHLHRRNH